MGSATLGGVAFEQGGASARRTRGATAAVFGQGLAHLLLALPGCALYLIVLPRVYGFSYSEHVLDLLILAIPFILAVSFLGQFVGMAFRRRETAVLLLVAVSLPIFFLVGVAWPPEAIPRILLIASAALPSTAGIEALVRVNQMGASFTDVFRDWARLWALVAVYAALAIAAGRLAGRERAHAH
jgi:ABC-2 type transport system permease protein